MKNKRIYAKLLMFTIVILISSSAAVTVILKVQNNVNSKLVEEFTKRNSNIDDLFESEEEQFINYISLLLKYYADNEYLFKIDENDEYVNVTSMDLKSNKEEYITKLDKVLEDEYIVFEKYCENNNKYFVYDINQLLSRLNLVLLNNTAFTDTNGMRLYVLGQKFYSNQEYINDTTLVEDRILRFGYNVDILFESIIQLTEKYVGEGKIYKIKNGIISLADIDIIEVKNNKETYKNILKDIINDEEIFKEIYLENKTLNCKYNFESILSSFNLSSDMGKGIEVDQKGNKIFSW